MNEKTYNGWTNYETWVVKLWMDNDETSYRAQGELAEEARENDDPQSWLAEHLKEDYEDASTTILEASNSGTSVWADLLGAALNEVNWWEIAEAILADNPAEAEASS